jgi:uncharacterized membrane protein YheB (UPF0754 family)
MNYWFLLIPFIGAAIGWCLNSLFIKLLISPVRPTQIAGITFHGLLFKKLPHFTSGLSTWAGSLISVDAIAIKLTGEDAINKLVPVVETQIDHFLKTKLAEKIPMLSMFIGEKTIGQIKSILVEEIKTLFPVLINQFLQNASNNIQVSKLIEEKINTIAPETIKQTILSSLKKELFIFKFSGVAIGFSIGLINLIIIHFI